MERQMRKMGNYRKADDISRCANCKHHYKVSRSLVEQVNQMARTGRINTDKKGDLR